MSKTVKCPDACHCPYYESEDKIAEVLDEIANELEEMRPTVIGAEEYWQGIYFGMCYVLDEALQIIDRHKAESEDEE